MLVFLLSIADDKDRDKVEEIYHRYHVDMYRIARHKLKGMANADAEAEEAVQNAFVKIIEYFDKIRFDEPEEVLKSYYYTIVTHEALDILSKESKTLPLDDYANMIADDDDFIRNLCIQTDYTRVVNAIINMDDRYSIPLQLKFLDMMSVNEIAAMLDMKPKTVYSLISRGKILLANRLGDMQYD